MMRKSILRKDAFQAITHSLGRYIAIILLIGLGTFAFVGLKMAGPDMRATGADFFAKHNLADVTVTSNYGINSTDRATIQNSPEVKQATFGYLQDAKVKSNQDVLQVFSQSNTLSNYELIKGHSQKIIKKSLFHICLKRSITSVKRLVLLSQEF